MLLLDAGRFRRSAVARHLYPQLYVVRSTRCSEISEELSWSAMRFHRARCDKTAVLSGLFPSRECHYLDCGDNQRLPTFILHPGELGIVQDKEDDSSVNTWSRLGFSRYIEAQVSSFKELLLFSYFASDSRGIFCLRRLENRKTDSERQRTMDQASTHPSYFNLRLGWGAHYSYELTKWFRRSGNRVEISVKHQPSDDLEYEWECIMADAEDLSRDHEVASNTISLCETLLFYTPCVAYSIQYVQAGRLYAVWSWQSSMRAQYLNAWSRCTFIITLTRTSRANSGDFTALLEILSAGSHEKRSRSEVGIRAIQCA